MAANDWIVAGINNPDFTTADFSGIGGMNAENTQMLSKEEYEKSDFIRTNPMFTDSRGIFDKEKFSDYYDKRMSEFTDLQEYNFYTGPALDMFDTDRTIYTPVEDIHFTLQRGINPDRQMIGIEGVNRISDPTMSRREIAKTQKVFNSKTGEFEDFTVNDHVFFSNPIEWTRDLFRDPLVMATWDEDGTHIDPMTGLETEHHKGEFKLNEKGTYYYETLGNRNPFGKDVLSICDTFTVDGSGINKLDFLDSNDIKKSVAGSIVNNVVAVLPYFIPGVGIYYAGYQAARELLRSMPTLYGWATAAFNNNPQQPNWVSKLAAYGARWTGSQSDYAREHIMAFENLAGTISMVAGQWGQQQLVIAKAINKLRGVDKIMVDAERSAQLLYEANIAKFGTERAEALMAACRNKFIPDAMKAVEKSQKLAQTLSTAYMGFLLNNQVYDEVMAKGASKREAAIISLGSFAGTFAIDSIWHLGEIFFKDPNGAVVKGAKDALRKEFSTWQEEVFGKIKPLNMTPKERVLGVMKIAGDKARKALTSFGEDLKYHTTNVIGKTVASGIQNTAEVLSSDFMKSLYNLAHEYGFNTSIDDYGAWENARERYIMNFVGGALGGTVFYGKEAWDRGTWHKPVDMQNLVALVRDGRADDLRSYVEEMYEKGQTGSKKLKAGDPIITKDGKYGWETTQKPEESQARAIADMVKRQIDFIEGALIENNANMSDEEMFNQMVLREERFMRYMEISGLTSYYKEGNRAATNLVNALDNLTKAQKTIEGTLDGTPIATDTTMTPELKKIQRENLQKYQDAVDKAKEDWREFCSGNNSLEYMRKLQFIMDSNWHADYIGVTPEEFIKTSDKYRDKKFETLSDEDRLQFWVDYAEYYKEHVTSDTMNEAWDKYTDVEKIMSPILKDLQKESVDYVEWQQKFIPKMKEELEKLEHGYVLWDTKLENESDEAYESRDKQMENESEEDFQNRKLQRYVAIQALNTEFEENMLNVVKESLKEVGGKVDAVTAREIRNMLGKNARMRDILNKHIQSNPALAHNDTLLSRLETLKADLSNVDEITAKIKQDGVDSISSEISEDLRDLRKKYKFIEKEDEMDLIEYLDEFLDLGNLKLAEIVSNEALNDDDPNKKNYFGALSPEDKSELLDALRSLYSFDSIYANTHPNDEPLDLTQYTIGDFGELVMADLAHSFESKLQLIADDDSGAVIKEIDKLVEDVKNDPYQKLLDDLDLSIVNPITALLTRIAEDNNDTIPDAEKILRAIQTDFDEISSTDLFNLNQGQIDDLDKIDTYLNAAQKYIYVASSTMGDNTSMGHNKEINMYAEKHKDELTRQWDKLPEINADVAASLLQAIAQYRTQIESWKQIAMANRANINAQSVAIDQRFCGAVYELLSKTTAIVTVNGHRYDLFEGRERLDTSLASGSLVQVPLYNLERLLYGNVQKFAAQEGMNVRQFVASGAVFEQLLPGIANINSQDTSHIGLDFKLTDFTSYDRLVYFVTILSADPAIFYGRLKDRVNADQNIAPLITQEYLSRINEASTKSEFVDLFSDAIAKTSIDKSLPRCPRIRYVNGIAGSGKSTVTFNSVNSIYKSDAAIVAGPNLEIAKNLADKLSRGNNYTTVEKLISEFIPEDLLNEIKNEFNNCKLKEKNDGERSYLNGKYFKIFELRNVCTLVLNTDEININENSRNIEAIFIDEVTHISSLELQLLHAIADKYDLDIFVAGDQAQDSYINDDNLIGNIRAREMVCIRTPRLSLSLRSGNLQIVNNTSTFRTIYDYYMDKQDALSNASGAAVESLNTDYMQAFRNLPIMLKKFQFQSYNQEEFNGHMIVPSLKSELVEKIKKDVVENHKTVAFVGKTSSNVLKMLQSNGIQFTSITDNNSTQKEAILSLNEIQGREFDYVFVDEDWSQYTNMFEGENNFGLVNEFMRKFYTALTRPIKGCIFIDNGLSKILGPNIDSKYKIEAQGIKDAIPQIRENKLKVLDAMNNFESLTKVVEPEEEQETQVESEQETEDNDEKNNTKDKKENKVKPKKEQNEEKIANKESKNVASKDTPSLDNNANAQESAKKSAKDNPIADFENPAMNKEKDQALRDAVIKADTSMFEASNPSDEMTLVTPDFKKIGRFIETWADIYFMGVHEVFLKGHKYPVWRVEKSNNGVLRNLQAIYDVGSEFVTYNEKEAAQKRLVNLTNLILYDEKEKLNVREYSSISRNDFENGKFLLEIRLPDRNTDTIPLYKDWKDVGMFFGGKQVVAEIVYSFKNKAGAECRLDIAAINNPDTLANNKEKIIRNMSQKIRKSADKNIIGRLSAIIQELPNKIDGYYKWFTEIVNRINDKNPCIVIDVNDATTPTKTPWAQKRRNEALRFGGEYELDKINGNTFDVKAKDNNNVLKIYGTEFVFSNKIIITNELVTKAGLDQSLSGKACVLWTSNTRLRPDELLGEYIKQKGRYLAGQGDYGARIRLAPLNNYGLSWSQLCHNLIEGFKKLGQSEGEEEFVTVNGKKKKKSSFQPCRQNYTGLRMFNSLWNARASLLQFKNAFENWLTQIDFRDQIDDVLRAHNLQYKAAKGDIKARDNLKKILDSGKITQEMLNEVDRFNNNVCLNIPMFRLSDIAEAGNLFHVQRYNVAGSIAYGDANQVNLCAITPKGINKFLGCLDVVLEPLVGSRTGKVDKANTLLGKGFKIKKKGEAERELSPDEILTFEESQRTLSHCIGRDLVDKSLLTLKYEPVLPDGSKAESITLDKADNWTLIPALLSKIQRNLLWVQMKNLPAFYKRRANLRLYKIKFGEQEGDVIQKGAIHQEVNLAGLFEVDSNGESVLEKSRRGKDGKVVIDRTFEQVLDLVFHGTTEDFHRHYSSENPLMQMDDAYFKHGFEISPDGAKVQVKNAASDSFQNADGSINYFQLIEVITDDALFELDEALRRAGVRLDLDFLIDHDNWVKARENEAKKAEVANKPKPKKQTVVVENEKSSVETAVENAKNELSNYVGKPLRFGSQETQSISKIKESLRAAGVSDTEINDFYAKEMARGISSAIPFETARQLMSMLDTKYASAISEPFYNLYNAILSNNVDSISEAKNLITLNEEIIEEISTNNLNELLDYILEC